MRRGGSPKENKIKVYFLIKIFSSFSSKDISKKLEIKKNKNIIQNKIKQSKGNTHKLQRSSSLCIVSICS